MTVVLRSFPLPQTFYESIYLELVAALCSDAILVVVIVFVCSLLLSCMLRSTALRMGMKTLYNRM